MEFDIISVKNFETNETDELLSVELSTVVPVSEVQFSCVFEGILNDKMVGLYRSKYNQVRFLKVVKTGVS